MADLSQGVLPVPSTTYSCAFPAIVVGGMIVGVLDLFYAIVVYSPSQPILVPQTIASGVLGSRSYSEGAYSCALGIFLHFVIALGAATVYYLASRVFRFLVSHPVASGLAYGAVVFVFMHVVVVPLSAVPNLSSPLIYQAFEFVWHWFGVGLPIALSVRYYSR